MEDLNKITSTRVGDNIHFFVNGTEDKGTVVKMNSKFVTVVKDDGNFQDIHVNDTFFIKDILVNKSWNDMNLEERSVKLHEIKAYSPRFLGKAWEQLPRELKDVMLKGLNRNEGEEPDGKTGFTGEVRELDGEHTIYTDGHQNPTHVQGKGFKGTKMRRNITRSNVEQGHYGSAGRGGHVVETNTDFDAPDDYEGQTEDEKKEQFKHEDKKPKTTNKTMQEQIWEEWLSKDGGMGGGSPPANTSMTTGTDGVHNPIYGKDGRIKGQGEDKEEDEDKERKG